MVTLYSELLTNCNVLLAGVGFSAVLALTAHHFGRIDGIAKAALFHSDVHCRIVHWRQLMVLIRR